MLKEENLRNIFIKVDEYAKQNFIYPKKYDKGFYYIIYDNETFYKLGIIEDKGTFFFLDETEEEEDYIDYNDVIENKERVNIDIIKFKLNQLKLVVTELSNVIPEEEIKKEIVKIYKRR